MSALQQHQSEIVSSPSFITTLLEFLKRSIELTLHSVGNPKIVVSNH